MTVEVPQQPTAHAPGDEPTAEEATEVLMPLGNSKAVGPDELSVEFLKFGLHQIIIRVCRKVKDSHNNEGQGRVRELPCGTSLVAQAGKALPKIVAKGPVSYCEAKVLLPEDQCGFRPRHSPSDMMFDVRRFQELGRKYRVPLCP